MHSDAIQLAANLKELTEHGDKEFPIQYYIDEPYLFKDLAIPFHWHQELEILTVYQGEVEVHIQQDTFLLKKGEGIYINPNVLHSYRQVENTTTAICPNIVFSQQLLSGRISRIQNHYITPITMKTDLPYLIFTKEVAWHQEILEMLDELFSLLQKYGTSNTSKRWPQLQFSHKNIESACYEMAVQNLLSNIWQILYAHRETIPLSNTNQRDLTSLIRIQKMIDYIHQNYSKQLSLRSICAAADIERSEATRCFQQHVNESPIKYLNSYRIAQAEKLLHDTTLPVNEIGELCGFLSASYFCRIFRREKGMSPSQYRKSIFSDSSAQTQPEHSDSSS